MRESLFPSNTCLLVAIAIHPDLLCDNRDAESLPFLRLATKARTDKVLVTMASSLCVYICATSTHVLRLEFPRERLRTNVHTQAPTPCFCPNQGAAEGVLATHFPLQNYTFDHKCTFQKA